MGGKPLRKLILLKPQMKEEMLSLILQKYGIWLTIIYQEIGHLWWNG